MKRICSYWIVIPIVFVFFFLLFIYGSLYGYGQCQTFSMFVMVLCVILQILLIINLKSIQSVLRHILVLVAFLILLLFLFCFTPFMYRTLEKDYNSTFEKDTIYSAIFDYYETPPPTFLDSLSWLIMKEGEYGMYYFEYSHSKIGKSNVILSVYSLDNPSNLLYNKKIEVSNEKENKLLVKDSFIVLSDITRTQLPSIFEIRIQNDSTKASYLYRKKYLLHRWRR